MNYNDHYFYTLRRDALDNSKRMMDPNILDYLSLRIIHTNYDIEPPCDPYFIKKEVQKHTLDCIMLLCDYTNKRNKCRISEFMV